MAAQDDVVTANLPLLFSEGRPVALHCLNAEDCQYFISFLMKCVLGNDVQPSQWRLRPRPEWWLPAVPWSSMILTKKYRNDKWTKVFQNLITSCYEWHGNASLLLFSKRLQQGHDKGWAYRYEANKNGTTTMYHVQTGKMMVTFRTENMTYDRGLRDDSTVRPALHPRLNTPSPRKNPASGASAVAILPRITELPCDIYLCDSCGEGFDSEEAVKAHEAQCSIGEEPGTLVSSSRACLPKSTSVKDNYTSSCNIVTSKEAEPEGSTVDQAQFLCGFDLLPKRRAESSVGLPESSSVPEKRQPKSKPFVAVPFCSVRGQNLNQSFRISSPVARSCVAKYDKYCRTAQSSARGPASRTGRPSLSSSRCWNISCRKVSGKRPGEWTHMYSFNKKQRLERLRTMMTGLTEQARRLLTQCRPAARVRLKRLTAGDILSWTQPKPKPLAQLPLKTYSNGQLHVRKRAASSVGCTSGSRLAPKASSFVPSQVQILPCEPDPSSLTSRDAELYILPDVTLTPAAPVSQYTLVPVPPLCQANEEPILIDLCSSSDEEESVSRRSAAGMPSILPEEKKTTAEAQEPSPVMRDRSLSPRFPYRQAKEGQPWNVPRDLRGLMQDECKELRHKGLENLLHADERVTRRRTASHPESNIHLP